MHLFFVAFLADDKADGIAFPLEFLVLSKIREILVHLSDMLVFEFFLFQIDRNKTLEFAVIEEKINPVILTSNEDFHLLTHEAKITTEF